MCVGKFKPNFLFIILVLITAMHALCGPAPWDVKADQKESSSNPLLTQPVSNYYYKPATLLSLAALSHDLLPGLLIFLVYPQKVLCSNTNMSYAVCYKYCVISLNSSSPV